MSEFWPFFTAFGALVAAGFGFPIPEEVPTLGAGIWVGSHPEFGPLRWLILPVCFLGVLISDVMLYGIGRLWGPRILQYRWVKRTISLETWRRIEHNYERYGIKALLMVRWLPAIRSPMFLSAGIMRLSFLRFVLADGVALMFGHSALFFLAFWLGDQSKEILQRVESIRPLIVVVILTAVATYLLIHFMRRPVGTGAPDDLPPIVSQVTEQVSHIIRPSKDTHHGIPLPDLNDAEINESSKETTRDEQPAPAGSQPEQAPRS
jgi:membrane protein DedA with SNARE-associated domain